MEGTKEEWCVPISSIQDVIKEFLDWLQCDTTVVGTEVPIQSAESYSLIARL